MFLYIAGTVKLLTHPHSAGYVQNPISVYYCHSSTGALSACIAEVSKVKRSRSGCMAECHGAKCGSRVHVT
jgi:DUF1365 family protein